MYKLLNQGFYRLRKNKIFWGLLVLTICIACFFLNNSKKDNSNSYMDELIMQHIGIMGFFISVFTSLFVGLEYANGTIRNKIVVGHSRIKIYLSNLIISITVGIIIEIVYILFVAIILKGTLILPSQFDTILLHIVMIIVMYSTIFNCMTLLCNDITVSTVIGIMIVLVMFIADVALAVPAEAEEYSYNYNYNAQGEETREINGLNPNYPGETKQKIAKIIRNITPIGQTNQIMAVFSEAIRINAKGEAIGEWSDTTYLLWYSLGTIIAINAMGIYFFSKKELK